MEFYSFLYEVPLLYGARSPRPEALLIVFLSFLRSIPFLFSNFLPKARPVRLSWLIYLGIQGYTLVVYLTNNYQIKEDKLSFYLLLFYFRGYIKKFSPSFSLRLYSFLDLFVTFIDDLVRSSSYFTLKDYFIQLYPYQLYLYFGFQDGDQYSLIRIQYFPEISIFYYRKLSSILFYSVQKVLRAILNRGSEGYRQYDNRLIYRSIAIECYPLYRLY